MVTQMITLKLEDSFLESIDKLVKSSGYQNRTELIRNAIREKIDKAKMQEAIMELTHLKGSSKKTISEKDYESIRKKAFESL